MPHCIASIFERLLQRLFPSPGRHRGADSPAEPVREDLPTLTLAPVMRAWDSPDDDTLVRPYVLTSGERREWRLQRERRRALWLVSFGVDAGPRRIHGVVVAS
ncbi:hypothetical protein [Streptomyces hoynatensis]|uniref:Uncharacterized protein n=1 Tax=Streptomyces hoynatensis TaxID=1141874 RepID=A0A3A9YP36_9ACTN|nr:hypothetical protein [Streptomyces hoynatensis]RKN36866.1 hypothetical protein D7294_29355 [Streptomyces hoynatensis]